MKYNWKKKIPQAEDYEWGDLIFLLVKNQIELVLNVKNFELYFVNWGPSPEAKVSTDNFRLAHTLSEKVRQFSLFWPAASGPIV